MSIINNISYVDDITQETFIRFFNAIHKFRKQSSLSTYLTRIAINLSLNEIKKINRIKEKEIALSNNKQIITHDEKIIDSYIINNSLQQLKPEYRIVTILRYINNLSTKETAKILKIPEGTVLTRLSRATKQLKILLKPHFGELYE